MDDPIQFAGSQEEITFEEVLTALLDEDKPFPPRYLYRLSGLAGEELAQVKAAWPQLSGRRRLGLLEDLEVLAESNTILHFDRINRLGLDDEDEQVRTVAIRSLWQSERPELINTFLTILDEDNSSTVRAQAAAALGRFVYLGELGKIKKARLREIEDRLLRILDEGEDVLVRRRALESLGYSGREEAASQIEEAYASDDPDWMASALYAMGRSVDQRWTPMVMERLDDHDDELSKEAARAAGELEIEDAVPALMNLLHDELPDIRLAAAWSLSQIGGNGVVDALEDMRERAEDEDEIDLIENALENLEFNQELHNLNLFDFSAEDLEDLISPDEED